jgi:hypothetical protein
MNPNTDTNTGGLVTRAKFRVESIERTKWPDGRIISTVKLNPVYGGPAGSENAAFFQATPSGRIELGCVSQAAAENFQLGEEYFVDFTHRPSVPAGEK